MGKNNLKNTNYSIYGHTFFGHNSAILGPIELKFFMGTPETIIYRLVAKNHDLVVFWKMTPFWWENGRGRHTGDKGSGVPKSDQKVSPLVWPYGSTIISKMIFESFQAWTPPLSVFCCYKSKFWISLGKMLLKKYGNFKKL